MDPWEHVFENIDDKPPDFTIGSSKRPTLQPQTTQDTARPRRQNITERELSAFNDMFGMIFDAVAEHRSKSDGVAPELPAQTRRDPLSGAGIGRGLGSGLEDGVRDLLGHLRLHSKKVKRTGEDDEAFERKREQIELCETDQQLLEWASREVFEESIRHEQAARNFVPTSPTSISPLPLQPPAYARTIALLMRTFRDRHHDPHMALALFQHTKRLSRASCVFGCTVPVYNELLVTRWRWFRDLRGVCDALEEMRVNGVEPDVETRRIVEDVRRDVGERAVVSGETDVEEEETAEAWAIMRMIEELSVRSSSRRKGRVDFNDMPRRQKSKRWNAARENWKLSDSSPNPRRYSAKSWRFGDWNMHSHRRSFLQW